MTIDVSVAYPLGEEHVTADHHVSPLISPYYAAGRVRAHPCSLLPLPLRTPRCAPGKRAG